MSTKQSTPTQTTTVKLSPEQQQILGYAMPLIENYAASTPQQWPGSTVAPTTDAQAQGQQMILNAAAGPATDLANAGASANNFLLGDIWNPSTNPYLQQAIDAAIRPITENYQQVVKPGNRDTFVNAGQVFGGSQRAKTDAWDANNYLRNVGDTASKLVQDQYANNLNAMVKALGLVPQTQATQYSPGVATAGVGEVQQAQNQAELNSAINQFYYPQYQDLLQAQDLVGLLGAVPGGSAQTVGSTPTSSPWARGLGGAATGASIGSVFGPVGSIAGAGLGGLLSFL